MRARTATRTGGTTTPLGRNRDFRLLLTSSSSSMVGSRVTAIAYPLLVLALTDSPVAAGWASFAAIAPSILFFLPAGALVDRWDPPRAMLVCEFGRGAAITSVIVAVALGRAGLPALIIAVAVEQIFEVFSTLAERRFARSLVEREQVTSALVRSEARTHLVVLLGRPLGALLFGFSHIVPFASDFLSFITSVSLLRRIRKRSGFSRSERVAGWNLLRETLREIGEGMGWLRSNPFAGVALPLTAGTTLLSQALIMVFFADAHLGHLSPVTIGVVLAASGLGGILGSAAASWLFPLAGYYLLQIQMLVWTVTFIFLALPGGLSYLVMATAMGILGFAGALGNIALETFVARNAGAKLARVMSIDRLTSLSALALGPPLGGILFARYGPQHATLVLSYLTGGLLAATAITSWVLGPASFRAIVSKGPEIAPFASRRGAPWAISGAVRVFRSLWMKREHQHIPSQPDGRRYHAFRQGEPAQLDSGLEMMEQNRTALPEDIQCLDENRQSGVGDGPAEAAGVVLAIRFVVSLLGPAYLIAADERRAARQRQ
jgi:hypothetical protein